jgi:hypothetical protein
VFFGGGADRETVTSLVEYECRQPYDHWRDRSGDFNKTPPYKLRFGRGVKPPLFVGNTDLESEILVTESYQGFFDRLLRLRASDPGIGGAVITGQPGTGVYH